MTIEEKQLLIQDLCGRLPYDVIVRCYFVDGGGEEVLDTDDIADMLYSDEDSEFPMYKPYLRPMSSMTEEERKELSDYLCEKVMSNKIGITIPPNPTQGKGIPFIWMGDCLDWLNEHHFDYRRLIEKGLALEAPKEMYKEE